MFFSFCQHVFHQFIHSFNPFIAFVKEDHLSRVLIAIVIFATLVLLFPPRKLRQSQKNTHAKDIQAIAGEDIVATQLDLAKAYIEMNKTSLAKQMLREVAKGGSQLQQLEAKQLIKAL